MAAATDATGGGLLVVTAHPDDETLIAGGTLAACSAAGLDTGVVCLTRGEWGPIADPSLATQKTLAAVRAEELRAACQELGVSWVKCYRRRDAHLPWTNATALVRQLARVIGKRRPAAVITFGEDGMYGHADHVVVGRCTRRAVEMAAASGATRVCLYESVWTTATVVELVQAASERGLPSDLWGIDPEDFGVADARDAVAIDVRPFVKRKLSALRAHRTQFAHDHLFAALDADLAEGFFGLERFRRVGGPSRAGDWLTRAVSGSL